MRIKLLSPFPQIINLEQSWEPEEARVEETADRTEKGCRTLGRRGPTAGAALGQAPGTDARRRVSGPNPRPRSPGPRPVSKAPACLPSSDACFALQRTWLPRLTG